MTIGIAGFIFVAFLLTLAFLFKITDNDDDDSYFDE